MYPFIVGSAMVAIWMCFSAPNISLYQMRTGRVPAGMQLVVAIVSGPIGSVIIGAVTFFRNVRLSVIVSTKSSK